MIDMQAARDIGQKVCSYDHNCIAIKTLWDALGEIDRLREENKNLQELFSIRADLQAKNQIAVKEEHDRELKAYAEKIKELKNNLIEERRRYILVIHPNATPEYAAGLARRQLEAEGKI